MNSSALTAGAIPDQPSEIPSTQEEWDTYCDSLTAPSSSAGVLPIQGADAENHGEINQTESSATLGFLDDIQAEQFWCEDWDEWVDPSMGDSAGAHQVLANDSWLPFEDTARSFGVHDEDLDMSWLDYEIPPPNQPDEPEIPAGSAPNYAPNVEMGNGGFFNDQGLSFGPREKAYSAQLMTPTAPMGTSIAPLGPPDAKCYDAQIGWYRIVSPPRARNMFASHSLPQNDVLRRNGPQNHGLGISFPTDSPKSHENTDFQSNHTESLQVCRSIEMNGASPKFFDSRPHNDREGREKPSLERPSLKPVKDRVIVKNCVCNPAATTKVPRPKNAFILFRSHNSKELMLAHNNNNQKVSATAGAMWQKADKETKEYFKALAEKEKKNHAKMYPGYKYNPGGLKSARFGNPSCTCGAYETNVNANIHGGRQAVDSYYRRATKRDRKPAASRGLDESSTDLEEASSEDLPTPPPRKRRMRNLRRPVSYAEPEDEDMEDETLLQPASLQPRPTGSEISRYPNRLANGASASNWNAEADRYLDSFLNGTGPSTGPESSNFGGF